MSKWRISVDADGTIRAASGARWVRHNLPGGPIFVQATAMDGGDAEVVVTENAHVGQEAEPPRAENIIAVAPARPQSARDERPSRSESYWAARRIARRQASSPLVNFDRWTIVLELVLPKRVLGEELGDARELVIRYLANGGGPWGVRVKLVTTVFWLLVNSVREVTSALFAKAGDRKKSG